jgi:hypothetical protein
MMKPMTRLNRPARWLGATMLTLALLAAAAPAFAQEVSPDQLALARKYVDLTDKVDIFGTTVAETAAQSLNQILKLNPTAGQVATDAVTDVVKQYKNQRGTLMDQIARVYAEKFTTDELQQFVTFYSTPAGQKLATTNFTINQQLQRVMQVFTVNLKTEFYAMVRAELTAKGVTL